MSEISPRYPRYPQARSSFPDSETVRAFRGSEAGGPRDPKGNWSDTTSLRPRRMIATHLRVRRGRKRKAGWLTKPPPCGRCGLAPCSLQGWQASWSSPGGTGKTLRGSEGNARRWRNGTSVRDRSRGWSPNDPLGTVRGAAKRDKDGASARSLDRIGTGNRDRETGQGFIEAIVKGEGMELRLDTGTDGRDPKHFGVSRNRRTA